jgi:predicted nucleotidyltransferase
MRDSPALQNSEGFMTRVDSEQTAIERISAIRQTLVRKGVRTLGLFGSFVRGEQTEESDVDILVDFTPEMHTFDAFMDISDLLEDTLGRRVDLVTRESLSPHIGPHILREVQNVPIAP